MRKIFMALGDMDVAVTNALGGVCYANFPA
jgi:hypothetical protein